MKFIVLVSLWAQDSVRKLNKIRGGFNSVFAGGTANKDKAAGGGGSGSEKAATTAGLEDMQQAVRQAAIRAADDLKARARREIGQLPFTS